MKIYAIGDIHGMYEHMKVMLDVIGDDGQIILLGDYVDRGPDSKKVLKHILADDSIIKLIGNHDHMAYTYAKNREPYDLYPTQFGAATLESYEGNMEELFYDMDTLMKKGAFFHETTSHVFSHSGGNPGLHIEENTTHDWIWYRHALKTANYRMDNKYTVHGHTPVKSPLILEGRCDVDTGCCYDGGHLSCAVFDAEIKDKPVEVIMIDHDLNIERYN